MTLVDGLTFPISSKYANTIENIDHENKASKNTNIYFEVVILPHYIIFSRKL